MCTIINLLKQYFLLLIIFCTYLERCSNFELEAIWISYVTASQCKWVSGVDTYEAEIAADSIIWELFAKKSAECLNLRNSFITIPILKNVFLLTWVILHHSPIITRANGSLNPDASEPIRDRAWYMCALTWKNWKGRIKHKRYENIFFWKSDKNLRIEKVRKSVSFLHS